MRSLTIHLSLNVLLYSASLPLQEHSVRPKPKPIETTVCKVLENPSAFNNRLVRVRGEVSVSFEYSVLQGEGCSEGIWFSLADGTGPPGLVAVVPGKGRSGGRNSKGAPLPLIHVRLVRDSNFEKFENYMQIKADQHPCLDDPEKPTPADCGVDRVIATFIGRIDGVSKEVHAAHLKRNSSDNPDFRGFGQMGLFDAQLVLQSVEDVEALDSFGRKKP